VTANEIRVQMGLNDVFDLQVLRRCFFDVLIDVTLRVHHGGFTVCAEQVRRVRETSQIELLEIHFDTFECLRWVSVERILSHFRTAGKKLQGERGKRGKG
jgi:hypothetical protein